MKVRLKAFHELNKDNFLLDNDDIIRNLKLLPDFFGHLLHEEDKVSDIKLDIEEKEIQLTIVTSLPQEEFVSVVEHAIRESKLYASVISCEQPPARDK